MHSVDGRGRKEPFGPLNPLLPAHMAVDFCSIPDVGSSLSWLHCPTPHGGVQRRASCPSSSSCSSVASGSQLHASVPAGGAGVMRREGTALEWPVSCPLPLPLPFIPSYSHSYSHSISWERRGHSSCLCKGRRIILTL